MILDRMTYHRRVMTFFRSCVHNKFFTATVRVMNDTIQSDNNVLKQLFD